MSITNKLDLEVKKSKELVHFADALDFMETRSEAIISGKNKQMIWFLEHHPVYTAGVSAKDEDLLQKGEIPVFKTNRGGKYTYHGPGMLIIYLMLDLKKLFSPQQPDVRKFVKILENSVIATLKDYGIKGEIRDGRIGIWTFDKNGNEKKIAALGIKLRKWVSYHGIAINVDPDLKGFNNIVPCGIKEFGVTSMQEILGQKIDISELMDKFLQKFDEVILDMLN